MSCCKHYVFLCLALPAGFCLLDFCLPLFILLVSVLSLQSSDGLDIMNVITVKGSFVLTCRWTHAWIFVMLISVFWRWIFKMHSSKSSIYTYRIELGNEKEKNSTDTTVSSLRGSKRILLVWSCRELKTNVRGDSFQISS